MLFVCLVFTTLQIPSQLLWHLDDHGNDNENDENDDENDDDDDDDENDT